MIYRAASIFSAPRFPCPVGKTMKIARRLDSKEIPIPSRGPARRPLTTYETAMNAVLFGDPDPAAKKKAEAIRAEADRLYQERLEAEQIAARTRPSYYRNKSPK